MSTTIAINIDEQNLNEFQTPSFERSEEDLITQNPDETKTEDVGNQIYGNLVIDGQGNAVPKGTAPTIEVKLDPTYFNLNEMKNYWDALFGVDAVLAPDETIRIVYFSIDPNEKPSKDKKNVNRDEGTYKGQINSFDQLIEVIKQLQSTRKDKHLGISIGAAIFKYVEDTAPALSMMLRTQVMVIDIDCYFHANKSQKDRVNFYEFTPMNTQFVGIQVYNKICQLLSEKNAPLIIPNKVYCTGGGFQIHLKFDEPLNKDEAKKVFDMYKHIMNSERFLVTGLIDSEIFGGTILDFYADIDMSFADITHVQRLGGMKNQKYNFMPLDISDIFGFNIAQYVTLKNESKRDIFNVSVLSSTELYETIKKYFNGNDETSLNVLVSSSSRTSDEKKFLYTKIDQILNNYSIYMKSSFGFTLTKQDYVSLTGMVIKSDKVIKEATSVVDASMNDILFKISGNTALNILREELDFRQDFGNLVRCNCPFHEESHASFAIYKNENSKTVLMDFHDNETYNIVTFWMKYKEVDRNTAINQLVSRAGITFTGKESKSLQKVLEKSSVDDLIKEIDTDNFIYYRLTSKQKSCIVRHIDSGESFIFDGSKMLADHILDNQLKQSDLDLEFRAIFHIAFVEHVLIDAFEEFAPGMPSHFSRGFIQFVNTWIPGKNYKEVHKLAATFEEMDIDSCISMLKANTPWMYKYLLQLTQKGNLKYFVNWLIASSQFRIMPILPILTSTYGTGKNLFVEEVLNFYFNAEYVNVMSADQVQSQFNSTLETCSMLVLDEGDFSKSKEVDNLKFLTGNNTLRIEKKGVDASKKKKWFNTVMLTNGECPIVHPIGERRFTYFRLETTLMETCNALGLETIDEFILNIREELVTFWAILTKTSPVANWSFQADKNNQYFKQILMMHTFGRLVIQMLDEKWQDITLQINESVDDALVMTNNIKMVNDIQQQFTKDGRISLTLINKYIKSTSFKNYISVQNFIQNNHLKAHGFSIETSSTGSHLEIVLDLEKIKSAISMVNNLIEIIPEHFAGVEEIELAIKNKENGDRKKLSPASISGIVNQAPNIGELNMKEISKDELNQFNPTLGVSLPGMPDLPGVAGGLNFNKFGVPSIPS